MVFLEFLPRMLPPKANNVYNVAQRIRKCQVDITVSPPRMFGPVIESTIVLPAKGIYKIFSQAQRHKKVLLFDFMVEVHQLSLI